jgi:hypothetical protein
MDFFSIDLLVFDKLFFLFGLFSQGGRRLMSCPTSFDVSHNFDS